jgi:hypothetical protein
MGYVRKYVMLSLYTPWKLRRSGGITPHVLTFYTRYLLILLGVATYISWIADNNGVLRVMCIVCGLRLVTLDYVS